MIFLSYVCNYIYTTCLHLMPASLSEHWKSVWVCLRVLYGADMNDSTHFEWATPHTSNNYEIINYAQTLIHQFTKPEKTQLWMTPQTTTITVIRQYRNKKRRIQEEPRLQKTELLARCSRYRRCVGSDQIFFCIGKHFRIGANKLPKS